MARLPQAGLANPLRTAASGALIAHLLFLRAFTNDARLLWRYSRPLIRTHGHLSHQ